MMRRILGALICLVMPSLAWAACPATSWTVKDGSGASQTFCLGGAAGNLTPQIMIMDTGGTNIAGVTAGNALKIDGSATTQPVSGTVTANAGTNLNTSSLALNTSVTGLQVGQASTTSGQSGTLVQGAVTTAAPSYTTAQTDPLSLTTGGALRQDFTTIAGNAPKVGSGNGSSTGSLNVYIATDQPSLANAQPGQFVSIGPIGSATAVSQGNGTTNNGDQRTNIASDNSAIANWGHGATAAAVPSGATYLGGNGSGNLTGITVCDNVKPVSFSSTTAQLMVSGVSAKKVHICSINLVAAAATNVALIEGTTTTNPCDTGTAGMAGGTTAATGWNFAANGGIAIGSGLGQLFVTATAADNVCLLASAGNQISGSIAYTVY